ncbi:hypothetical protein A5780_09215 [Nocardia sp. 852002-20019_SCH5090214]|uniref:DUF4267 domain-containing protein n=1 Tax=Nocardia nova TaxID=37330 RepID=A0A2S6A127_9NOCA|nr:MULTISPECIES: hypothetical protein [Nocardia]OBF76305.1 hypothetical protein A9X06_24865 [Mycobacterium sp. 852002-51759_SCH5129042]MBF6273566.1 hypothetical protein [Nocardia nova]MBV7704540.1 hypothetical protein [Nocardia nova]OBA53541.1 hypothetical protein A5789_02305 [Nocardia sp. 852002-51101_SCH5132738]OBA67994.1 hypothetical protein A5780_09215 [Nocardia sp. 852002-20019_SCH5090214]
MVVLAVVANSLVAVISGVSCLIGLARPRLALAEGEELTSAATFFLGAYAARALPLSVVTVAVLVAGGEAATLPVLVIAGLAQVGDAIIGVRQRNTPMAITCVGLAAVHLATAVWLFAR